MTGIYRFKPKKDRVIHDLAAWLIKHGINANQITLAGLIIGITAVPFLLMRLTLIGLTLMVLSVFSDLLDGTIARLSGSDSLNGKLFDALSDRVIELSWVGALVFNGTLSWWGWLMPLCSFGLLFARYLAFQRGIETSFVPFTRFERITAIFGTLLIPWRWLSVSVYLLVVGGTAFSIILIIHYVHGRCRQNITVTGSHL
ncbi:MAG TPA: CDP-alcohol phosphatidyltransferase family protein [Bacillota bacterium]|nr:CDP-alcohol phosphatidyltransferase family protein [Bacillota bacterium]